MRPSSERQDPDDPRADLALVRVALQGDEAARERLARRLTVVLRILVVLNRRHGARLTSQDVEDLAQDTLLLAWRKLAAFHGETSIDAWLYRFCVLEYLNRVRLRSRAPRTAALDPAELRGREPLDPPEERLRAIELCLAQLGAPDASVIRLKHGEGLSFSTIAERLALPASTVKTRYYRGIAWMQRKLRTELQEAEP